jgi:ubiquinone/menaquinone biosynthesis C-methylase UbiE
MAETVTDGIVLGIDHSAVMLEQASRRNRSAISRVRLLLASVSNPPAFDSPLDKILDINSFQSRENPVRNLEKLRLLLRDGGRMVLVHQPRKPGSTGKDVDTAGVQLARCLEDAGFRDIAIRKRAMQPVAAIAVIGTK